MKAVFSSSWPEARSLFALSWLSLIFAPRKHPTLTFSPKARDNFLDSMFLTIESPIEQAVVDLSALLDTSFDV